MLFVVVILFAISWLPLQTFSMIMFLYPEIREDFEYQSVAYNIFIGTYFACHWLSMAHSCLNPLIYCFMNDKFRSDLHELLCNTRNVYSHCAPSQSNNKSFHQAAYQNNLGQLDNSSSNNNNNNNSYNNCSGHGERKQTTGSPSVRSNLRSQGRLSTYASSSSGGATSGRVARLSLRTPEGANEPATSQVMTNAPATATTLVTAAIVTTALPTTDTTTTKTIASSERLSLNGPTFKTNSCVTSSYSNNNNSNNNQDVQTARKNEILANLDLKNSIYIVNNGKASESIVSETKNTTKRCPTEGEVFVEVLHRPKLGKRQISTIYKWPPEDGLKTGENKQANKVDGHQQDAVGNNKHEAEEGAEENEREGNVNSDEEDEEEDELEQDCSRETSLEEKAARRAGISNV